MKKIGILDCLYPEKCAGCEEIIEDGKYLCDYCSLKMDNTNYKLMCSKCGFEKDYCRCKIREYHYLGAVSTFKNSGIAKKVYYSYKLGRREELADIFAIRAARAVKAVFGDMMFDAVCCVPTAHRSKLKRGFDHSEQIAVKLADRLDIRFLPDVLKTRHFKPLQHKSTFPQRVENVRGKYYTDKKINADRVLIFDDILTSGATLDECAKELLFAGAKEVYCVTVLATYSKKKTNGGK